MGEKKVTLKLDIDGSYGRRKKWEIAKRLMMIKKFTGASGFKIKEEKSKHGYHVYIEFDPKIEVDDKDVVFFQLLLLSDWKREFFNWVRVKHKLPHWNILFKRKVREVKR